MNNYKAKLLYLDTSTTLLENTIAILPSFSDKNALHFVFSPRNLKSKQLVEAARSFLRNEI